MKTSQDPRHQNRIALVKQLYTYDFQKTPEKEIEDIITKLEEIDTLIASVATDHPLSEINKVDLAILRLGVFELMEGKVKPEIIFDEAIETAKEFGAEHSPKFINAVLSTIAKKRTDETTK